MALDKADPQNLQSLNLLTGLLKQSIMEDLQ